jgi:hypothetical protein
VRWTETVENIVLCIALSLASLAMNGTGLLGSYDRINPHSLGGVLGQSSHSAPLQPLGHKAGANCDMTRDDGLLGRIRSQGNPGTDALGCTRTYGEAARFHELCLTFSTLKEFFFGWPPRRRIVSLMPFIIPVQPRA